jgi:predicted secreted hydrolase
MRRASGALVAALLLLSACARPVAPLPAAPTPAPATPESVTFPRDALPHDVLTEWWYFTGHLSNDYGFEFTVFQARRHDAPGGYLAHFALSDVAGQRFRHEVRFTQAAPTAAFPLRIDGWTLGAHALEATMMDGSALRLRVIDEKPPALHNGGFIDLGAGGGSYYYSRTRLAVSGDLNGTPVTGQAWMDHQWGDFVVAGPGGWDWYSLQLDDNTEVMLYVLRGAPDAPPVVYGTFVAADGTAQAIQSRDLDVRVLGGWTSPHTGAVYPSGWHLGLNGVQLELQPRLLDQELYSATPIYWEGAVSISGDRTGRGYVELTGYADR